MKYITLTAHIIEITNWSIGNALTSHKPSLWALRICLFEIKTQRSTHWLRYILSTKLENGAKANCIYLLVHSSSQFTGNINYPVSIKVKKKLFAVQNSSHYRSITNGLHQNQIRIRCMALTSVACTECTVVTSQIHCIESWTRSIGIKNVLYGHQNCMALTSLVSLKNGSEQILYEYLLHANTLHWDHKYRNIEMWIRLRADCINAYCTQIHCIEITNTEIQKCVALTSLEYDWEQMPPAAGRCFHSCYPTNTRPVRPFFPCRKQGGRVHTKLSQAVGSTKSDRVLL